MTRTIKLYNEFHLGDQIFNFILFYNIKTYLEKNEIFIDYYCNGSYHNQIHEFNCSENIRILNIDEEGDKGLNFWIGNKEFNNNHKDNLENKKAGFDIFYVKFFNEFLEKYDIPIIIEKLEYKDPNLEERYKDLDIKHNGKYSDLDYLILNSKALSSQYEKNDEEWNVFIKKLTGKYKVVSSEKVDSVNCSRDDNLTIKDIAAISTRAKKIIAVNSGVVPGLFNTYTLSNVEVIYFFDNFVDYNHPKFKRTSQLNELNFLLEDTEGFQNLEFSNYNYKIVVATSVFIIFFITFYNNIRKSVRHLRKYISSPKHK